MSIQRTQKTMVGRSDKIPISAFGKSLSTFFALNYLLCVALRFLVPDVGDHIPWFQFFPGFSWTPVGILTGFVESIAYGWYVAVAFGWLFNFFATHNA